MIINLSNLMIQLIPYTQFTLKTHLSAHEAEQRLAKHIESRSLLPWVRFWNHKYFMGTMGNGKFHINRINHNRYYFRPIIIGQIHNNLGTTSVEITMRLSYLGITFIVLFIPIFVVFSLPDHDMINAFYISFVILIILYVFGILQYTYEANKARRYLEKIFEADTFNN